MFVGNLLASFFFTFNRYLFIELEKKLMNNLPSYPAVQLQRYELIKGVHVELCWHGDNKHLSINFSHLQRKK